jgi:hypothetical protein
MATTTHVPVEVYLRSSYEPDAEYVDGKIEKRPMAEFDHASWQLAIQVWFWQHEKEWGIRVLPDSAGARAPHRTDHHSPPARCL